MKLPNYLKIISISICCIFTSNTICLSAPHPIYSVKVDPKHGRVSERWRGTQTSQQFAIDSSHNDVLPTGNVQLPTDERMVILVQDAHESYEAQINIASILEEIGKTTEDEDKGLSLPVIGIEGAIGKIDVAALRQFPIPEARRKTAESLLRQGYITGSEYSLISAEHELEMWGIEDGDIFRKDFAAFLKVLSEKDAIASILQQESAELVVQKERNYSPELQSFAQVEEKYCDETISFEDFCVTLFNAVSSEDIDLSPYVHVQLFQEVLHDARTNDAEETYKESLLNYSELLVEIKRLANEVKLALAGSQRERVIIERDNHFKLTKKIYALRATRDEVDEWKATLAKTDHSRLSLPDSVTENVLTFYALAESRDQAMLDNLLSKMDEENKTHGVIVAGGYHSDGIKRILRERNIAYAVISPQINNIHEKIGYMDRMLGNIAPIDPILTSYITPALFSDLSYALRDEYADSAFVQQVQEGLLKSGGIHVSRINANMEAICGEVGRNAITEYFGDVWSQEIAAAPDWASVVYLLQESANVEVQKRANAIYALSRKMGDKINDEKKDGQFADLDSLINNNQFIDQLGALLIPSHDREDVDRTARISVIKQLFGKDVKRRPYGPRIQEFLDKSILNLQISEGCVEGCLICIHRQDMRVSHMPFDEVCKALDDVKAAGMETVSLCMDFEPFAYYDTHAQKDLSDVINAIHERGLKVWLITHGWRKNNKRAQRAAEKIAQFPFDVEIFLSFHVWHDDVFGSFPGLWRAIQKDVSTLNINPEYAPIEKLQHIVRELSLAKVLCANNNTTIETVLDDRPDLESLYTVIQSSTGYRFNHLTDYEKQSLVNFNREIINYFYSDAFPNFNLSQTVRDKYIERYSNVLETLASKDVTIKDVHDEKGFFSPVSVFQKDILQRIKEKTKFKHQEGEWDWKIAWDKGMARSLSDFFGEEQSSEWIEDKVFHMPMLNTPFANIFFAIGYNGKMYFEVEAKPLEDVDKEILLGELYTKEGFTVEPVKAPQAKAGAYWYEIMPPMSETLVPRKITNEDMPAMAMILQDGRIWEQPQLSPAQHRVINEAWAEFFQEKYEPDAWTDPIKEDLIELLDKAGVLGDLDVNIHTPPDEKLYDRIYKLADTYNVVFPERSSFVLLTHPGTYRNKKTGKPRSYNLLIPESVYEYLTDAVYSDSRAYFQWFEHEFSHLLDNAKGVKRSEAEVTKENPIEDFLSAYLDWRQKRDPTKKGHPVSDQQEQANDVDTTALQTTTVSTETDADTFVPAIALEERGIETLHAVSDFLTDRFYSSPDEPYVLEIKTTIARFGTISVDDVLEKIVVCSDLKSDLHGEQKIRFELGRDPSNEDQPHLKISVFDSFRNRYSVTNYYKRKKRGSYPKSILSGDVEEGYKTRYETHINFFCTKESLDIGEEEVFLPKAAKITARGTITLPRLGTKIHVVKPGEHIGEYVDLRLLKDGVHGTVLESRIDGAVQNYHYYDRSSVFRHLRQNGTVRSEAISLTTLDVLAYLDGVEIRTPRVNESIVIERMINDSNAISIGGQRVRVSYNPRHKHTRQNIALSLRNYANNGRLGKTLLEVALQDKKNPSVYRTSMILDTNGMPINSEPLPDGFSRYAEEKKAVYFFLKYGIAVVDRESSIAFDAGMANAVGEVKCFNDPVLSLTAGVENGGKDVSLRFFHTKNHGPIISCEVDGVDANYYFINDNGELEGLRKPISNGRDYISLAYLSLLKYVASTDPLTLVGGLPFRITSHVYNKSVYVHGVGYLPVFTHRKYDGTKQTVEFVIKSGDVGASYVDVYHSRDGQAMNEYLAKITKNYETGELEYTYSETQDDAFVTPGERAILDFLHGADIKSNVGPFIVEDAGRVTKEGTIPFIEKGFYLRVCRQREDYHEQVDLKFWRDKNHGWVLACIVNGEVKNYYYRKNRDGELMHLHSRGGEALPPISLTYIDFLRFMEGKYVRFSEEREPFEIERFIDHNVITIGKQPIKIFEHGRFSGEKRIFQIMPKPVRSGGGRVCFTLSLKTADASYTPVALITHAEDGAFYMPHIAYIGETTLSKEEKAVQLFVEKKIENVLNGNDEIVIPDAGTVNARGAIALFRTGIQLRIAKYGEYLGKTVSLRLFKDITHGVLLECSIDGEAVNYYFIDEEGTSLRHLHGIGARLDSNLTLTHLDLIRFFDNQKCYYDAERIPFDITGSISHGQIVVTGIGKIKVVTDSALHGQRRSFRFVFVQNDDGDAVLNVLMKAEDEDAEMYKTVSQFEMKKGTNSIAPYYFQLDANTGLSEEEMQAIEDQKAILKFVKNRNAEALADKEQIVVSEAGVVNSQGEMSLFQAGPKLKIGKRGTFLGETVSLRLFRDLNHGLLLESNINGEAINYYYIDEKERVVRDVYSIGFRQDIQPSLSYLDLMSFFNGKELQIRNDHAPIEIATTVRGNHIFISGIGDVWIGDQTLSRGGGYIFRFGFVYTDTQTITLTIDMKERGTADAYVQIAQLVQNESSGVIESYNTPIVDAQRLDNDSQVTETPIQTEIKDDAHIQTEDESVVEKDPLVPFRSFLGGAAISLSKGENETILDARNISDGRLAIPGYGRLTIAKRNFYTEKKRVRLRFITNESFKNVLEIAVEDVPGVFIVSAYYIHEFQDKEKLYTTKSDRSKKYILTSVTQPKGISSLHELAIHYYLQGYAVKSPKKAEPVMPNSTVSTDGSVSITLGAEHKKMIACRSGDYYREQVSLRLVDDINHGVLLEASVTEDGKKVITNYYYRDEQGVPQSLRNTLQTQKKSISLSAFDILTFLSGKKVESRFYNEDYVSAGILRARGLVNLPIVGKEIPVADKDAYPNNDKHVTFRYFVDEYHDQPMVACLVDGVLENVYYHEDGEVKHFRDSKFSRYFRIRNMYEYDMAMYLRGKTFDDLPKRRDEHDLPVQRLSVRQKVKKARLSYFFAKNIKVGSKYDYKDLALEMVDHPTHGICLALFAEDVLIGFLVYDKEKSEPFFSSLDESINYYQSETGGYIYKGTIARRFFEKSVNKIKENDRTDVYRKELFRIVKQYEDQIPSDVLSALFEKIRTISIYGFQGIVKGKEDFFLGKYDHQLNELFVAQDIMHELEKRGPPSLQDEYLLHELLCPLMRRKGEHYKEGHYRAIALQKKIFSSHFQSLLPLNKKQRTQFERKGLLGKAVRNCITVKNEYSRDRYLVRRSDGFLKVISEEDRVSLLADSVVAKVHVLNSNNLVGQSMEYMYYDDCDSKIKDKRVYVVWRQDKKKQLFEDALFYDLRDQGKLLSVDDPAQDGAVRHSLYQTKSEYAKASIPYHYEELLSIVKGELGEKYVEPIKLAYISAYNYWDLRQDKDTKQYIMANAVVRALNVASIAPRIMRGVRAQERYANLIAASLLYGIPSNKLRALDEKVVSLAQKCHFMAHEIQFEPDSATRSRYYLYNFKNMLKDMVNTPEELILYLFAKVEQFEKTRQLIEQLNLSGSPEEREYKKEEYEEAIHVVAALASDYGLSDIAREIKKQYFKEYDIAEYLRIKKMRNERIKMRKTTAYAYRDHVIFKIQEFLKGNGYSLDDVTVTGRVKDPVSISEKGERNYSIENMHDIFAFRIVVNTRDALDDCWRIRGLFRDDSFLGIEDPERYDDFISRPRRGYQALQLGFLHDVDQDMIGKIKQEIGEDGYTPDSIDMELQIRTREMDRVARFGPAADSIKKARERGHRHYMLSYVPDISVDLEKNIQEIKKQLAFDANGALRQNVYIRLGTDIVPLLQTDTGPTPVDALAHQALGSKSLQFEEAELVLRGKEMNERKKFAVKIGLSQSKRKGTSRSVKALSSQLRSGDMVSIVRWASRSKTLLQRSQSLISYRDMMYPWATLYRTKVLIKIVGQDEAYMLKPGRAKIEKALSVKVDRYDVKPKLLYIARHYYDLSEELFYKAVALNIVDIVEVKEAFESIDFNAIDLTNFMPSNPPRDGMIMQGEKSALLFEHFIEEGNIVDATKAYRQRLSELVDSCKAHLPDDVFLTIKERLTAMSIYTYTAIVQAEDDFALGRYVVQQNSLYIASDLIEVLSKDGSPRLVDEYLLHELLCPLMQREGEAYQEGHHRAIQLQKLFFSDHYREDETGVSVPKGSLGKALRSFINGKVALIEKAHDDVSFPLPDNEIDDIVTFFSDYPKKLDYIHNDTTGMPQVIEPVHDMVQARLKLYRAIQVGDIEANIVHVRDRAYSICASFKPLDREYRSIEYELSLLGVSPINGEITVPRYLLEGEDGLMKETHVRIPTLPVKGNWTHAVGFNEEVARYRWMQISFDPPSYSNALFNARQFESELRQLELSNSVFDQKSILEIGAYHGRFEDYINVYVDPKSYVGIDFDPLVVSDATGSVFAANNKALPFADGTFDLILLNNFLGPCYEDELKRVLADGGTVLVLGDPLKFGGLENGLYRFRKDEDVLTPAVQLPSDIIKDELVAWIEQQGGENVSRSEVYARLLSTVRKYPKTYSIFDQYAIERIVLNTFQRIDMFPDSYLFPLSELFSWSYKNMQIFDASDFLIERKNALQDVQDKYGLSDEAIAEIKSICGFDKVVAEVRNEELRNGNKYYELAVYYENTRPGLFRDLLAPISTLANVDWVERLHLGAVRQFNFGIRVPSDTDIEGLVHYLNLVADDYDESFDHLKKQKWILECEISNNPGALYEIAEGLAEQKIRLSAFLTPATRVPGEKVKIIFELEVPDLRKEQLVYKRIMRQLRNIERFHDAGEMILIPGELITRIVYELVDELNINLSDGDLEKMQLALSRIGRKHLSKSRKNRINSYISHFTEVAKIFVDDIGVKSPRGLLAALLHDVIEDDILTSSQVREMFGFEVGLLVDLVTRYEPKDDGGEKRYFKRLLTDEPEGLTPQLRAEAILVKIADRIHNLRTLRVGKKSFERRIFFETVDIFIPDFIDMIKEVELPREYMPQVERALEQFYRQLFLTGKDLGFINTRGNIIASELAAYVGLESSMVYAQYQKYLADLPRSLSPDDRVYSQSTLLEDVWAKIVKHSPQLKTLQRMSEIDELSERKRDNASVIIENINEKVTLFSSTLDTLFAAYDTTGSFDPNNEAVAIVSVIATFVRNSVREHPQLNVLLTQGGVRSGTDLMAPLTAIQTALIRIRRNPRSFDESRLIIEESIQRLVTVLDRLSKVETIDMVKPSPSHEIVAKPQNIIEGVPIEWRIALTEKTHTSYVNVLTHTIRYLEDHYFGLINDMRDDKKSIHITYNKSDQLKDDGNIYLHEDDLMNASASDKVLVAFIEKRIVPELAYANPDAKGMLTQALLSIDMGSLYLTQGVRDYFERVFWVWRAEKKEFALTKMYDKGEEFNALVAQNRLLPGGYRKCFTELFDALNVEGRTDIVARHKQMFLYALMFVQVKGLDDETRTYEDAFRNVNDALYQDVSVGPMWQYLVQPYAQISEYVDEFTFSNQWIQAEDAAIDQGEQSDTSNRQERIASLGGLQKKATMQQRDITIFIDEDLRRHELFSIIEKVITLTRSTGIDIDLNTERDHADLVLAIRKEDIVSDHRTVLFSLDDTDRFCREVAVFRSVFIRLMNESLSDNGVVSFSLDTFKLLHWDNGYTITNDIVAAFDDDIVAHLKTRLVQTAA